MAFQYQRSSDGLPTDAEDKLWFTTSADYCIRTVRHHMQNETAEMSDNDVLLMIQATGAAVGSLQLRAV